jgi:hypothetical protein
LITEGADRVFQTLPLVHHPPRPADFSPRNLGNHELVYGALVLFDDRAVRFSLNCFRQKLVSTLTISDGAPAPLARLLANSNPKFKFLWVISMTLRLPFGRLEKLRYRMHRFKGPVGGSRAWVS